MTIPGASAESTATPSEIASALRSPRGRRSSRLVVIHKVRPVERLNTEIRLRYASPEDYQSVPRLGVERPASLREKT